MTNKLLTSQLPQNWIRTRLDFIAEIVLGQSPPSSTYNESGKGLPFYQGKLEFGKVYPSPKKWCSEPKKIAEKGDVLVSVRAPVGPTNICPEKSCIGRGLAAIRGLGGIETLFILYLLRANENVLAGKGTGTTFSAISGGQLCSLEIPLPPLNEQRRIVGKVEELFSFLDAGGESLRKVQGQLKRYRQAVLKYAFEGKLTEEWRKINKDQGDTKQEVLSHIKQEFIDKNRAECKILPPVRKGDLPYLVENWVWTRVDWLCDVQTGPFGTQLHKSDYADFGIPTIEIGDVHPRRNLKEGTAHFVSKEKAMELHRFQVRPGDVLFTRVGTVGRCTLVPTECDGWIMSTSLIRVRTKSKRLLPEYLLFYFWSPVAQSFARGTSKGTTRAGTNSKIVGELPLIVPKVEEQRFIIEEIERLFSIVDGVEKSVIQNLRYAERLRQSILEKAFEGKLVSQDPADEPAERLLERIKAKRENNNRYKSDKQLELSGYVK